MPDGRDDADDDRRLEHAEDRLHPLQQKSAPSEFLAGWSADQENEDERQRRAQPAGRIEQVRNGTPLQDVDAENGGLNHDGCDQRGRIPPNADAPAEGLTEKLAQPPVPRRPRNHGHGREKGSERTEHDQYRGGRRSDGPHLMGGRHQRKPADPGDPDRVDREDHRRPPSREPLPHKRQM